MSDTAPADNKSQEVCRSFRNHGKCKFGDDCKYEHSTGPPIQPPADRKPPKECFNWAQEGNCQHGDRCRYNHGADDKRYTGSITDETCQNFWLGRCLFGDNCLRKHIDPTPEEKEELENRLSSRQRGRRKRRNNSKRGPRPPPRTHDDEGNPLPKIDEVCRNWIAGRCRSGDDCRRKHEGEQVIEVCRNYQAGRCRNGDDCYRIHEDPTGDDSKEADPSAGDAVPVDE